MPDIEPIIKTVAEFGVTAVIVGIFLYVIIRLLRIAFNWLESKVYNKKHDKLLDVRSSVDQQVTKLLDSFLETHDGERIQVIEFNNSVTSVAYLPFKYMTCTYEVYSAGLKPLSHTIDHLSTSLFAHFFLKLQDVPYYIFDATADQEEIGGAMMDLLRTSGEPHAICTLLKSVHGKSIGFLMMKKEDEFARKDYQELQQLATSISTLLCVVDK